MARVVPESREIKTFRTEAAFEAWMRQIHAREREVWLRIYKKGSVVPSITIAEALDVVLCWGWIDGIRQAFDERSYLQRYTPRRPKSIWSQINRAHVARLRFPKSDRSQSARTKDVSVTRTAEPLCTCIPHHQHENAGWTCQENRRPRRHAGTR
jgi:hypothetical protein